jgi:hypothetical protein
LRERGRDVVNTMNQPEFKLSIVNAGDSVTLSLQREDGMQKALPVKKLSVVMV